MGLCSVGPCFCLKGIDNFLSLDFFVVVFLDSVLVNQPTVHIGGVSRGRVCGCERDREFIQ